MLEVNQALYVGSALRPLTQREATGERAVPPPDHLFFFYCSVKYRLTAVEALILYAPLGGKSPPAASQTLVTLKTAFQTQ